MCQDRGSPQVGLWVVRCLLTIGRRSRRRCTGKQSTRAGQSVLASRKRVPTSFADEGGEEVIRLISARAATSKERKPYEEAHKRAEAASRRHRRHWA
jgi:hypothetical protein